MAQLFHFHHPVPPARTRELPPTPAATAQPGTTNNRRRVRFLLYGLLIALLLLIALVEFARAGGPEYVAGVSYFNAGLAGQPVTWQGGTISYYTDRGDLSPLLHGPGADAFVADTFARWTGISTAAVSAIRTGQLAEDVSGANVILNADRTITLPADIQPTATATPVGIVYDADGAVTEALLGTGSSGDCFNESAFGGPDAFTVDGHFAHALVIINGLCAQTDAQLPDTKYHLVRVLGQIFGLGWSQLNLNVTTGSPSPSSDDQAGFPLMHEFDPISCVPISSCYPNADQPKLDDQAALSRLYPVTSSNIGQFAGKQLFAANTARIHGSVRFTDANGNPAQPMQGANVVARWIDPDSGQPSSRYAAASVSGFLFCGNAGNTITGYNDPLGEPLNRFGSSDAALEGFFDLAGLVIPAGSSGQFQLSVEGLDPLRSKLVGPYAPWPVLPSGTAPSITVTLNLGGDVQQDIVMQDSATQITDAGESSSYASPRPLPRTGLWTRSLSPYGDADYFSFSALAGRTMVIDVTALDDAGQPTEQKAQPVIGMWSISNPPGTAPPALTSSAFNISKAGVTRLNAQLLSSTQFRMGIADLRGDGRPDYHYSAHVLYGESVEPSRVSVRGSTPIEVDGIGFRTGVTLAIGNTNASPLAISSTEIYVTAPPIADGTESVSITDPTTGASVTLQDALTFGAGPNDLIRLMQGVSSATPVGGEAPYPIRVMVATSDGSTPVGGATVQWSVNNGGTLTACGGAATCSLLTDESGKLETRVDIGATGTTTVMATLAPASYSSPKFVQSAVTGTSSATDLVLLSPRVWAAQGATVDVPLNTRFLSNGAPVSGKSINFQVGIGSGTLSPTTATTDSNGYAHSTLHVPSIAGDVQGTACLAPSNNPCQSFYVLSVPSSAQRLETVSGSLQAIWVGQSFQPLWLRVTDLANPPNPVLGASVSLQGTMFLPSADEPMEGVGETASSQHAMKVLLGSFQRSATTDGNGLISLIPSAGGLYRPLDLQIIATAGASALLQFDLQVLPPLPQFSPGASVGEARVPLVANGSLGKARVSRQRTETAPRKNAGSEEPFR